MRKTITILAIFINLLSIAQSVPTKINIIKVSPDTLCLEDSLNVYFNMIQATGGGGQTTILYINAPLIPLWTGTQSQILVMPMQSIGHSIYCYCIKVKVPVNTVTGTYSIIGSYGTWTNSSFYLKNCVTNVPELHPPPLVEPIYFNFCGDRINKKHNEFIIEQVGLTRKKIYISE